MRGGRDGAVSVEGDKSAGRFSTHCPIAPKGFCIDPFKAIHHQASSMLVEEEAAPLHSRDPPASIEHIPRGNRSSSSQSRPCSSRQHLVLWWSGMKCSTGCGSIEQ